MKLLQKFGLTIFSFLIFNGCTTYKKVNFGFNGCNVKWGQLLENVNESEMKSFAKNSNAEGFTYHPKLRKGKVLVESYPLNCKASPKMSWPLYLASNIIINKYDIANNDELQIEQENEMPLRFYKRMDFGYNGCDLNWGELIREISRPEMEKIARRAGAKGFTYHSKLMYGKILINEYPADCKSKSNLSWPLYLLK